MKIKDLSILSEVALHLSPTVSSKSTKFDSKFQFDGSVKGLHGVPKKQKGTDGKTYYLNGKNIVAVWDDVGRSGRVYDKPSSTPLKEGKDFFPEVDVIRIDPDRADVYDITHALLPTLVRIAYTILCQEKIKYERTHTDEDDDKFEFTISELEDKVDSLINDLRSQLGDLSGRDTESVINSIKDEFKDKLDEE